MRVVEFSPNHPIILDGEIPFLFSPIFQCRQKSHVCCKSRKKQRSIATENPIEITPIYWGYSWFVWKRGAPNIVPYPVDK